MNTLLTSLVLTSLLAVPIDGEYIPLEKIAPVGPQDEKELVWGTIKPLECGIERVVPPETLIGNYFLENGLEVFIYDTNKDGEFDVAILLPQGDSNRYPLTYMFDRDYDGDPDIKWEDNKRDGTCGDNLKATWIGDGVNGKSGKET